MTTNNPTPTQPETLLEPCPFCGGKAESSPTGSGDGGICVDKWAINCRVCNFEMIEMATEGDNPFYLTALRTLTTKWNRRAAVAGPRGDAATTARNRDEAQEIIMASEEALGQCYDAATRHDLVSRITEALDAAPSFPVPAESDEVKVDVKISKETGGAYADVRQVIKSELARIGQRLPRLPFICGKCNTQQHAEGICANCGADALRTQPTNATIAPPERAQVAGEQSYSEGFDDAARVSRVLNNVAAIDSARRAAREWMDTYHAAFKTNQEREDALAAIISKHFAAAPPDDEVESLLQHVAYSGVEFDDNRMGYVVVQIDRDVWEQIQKIVRPTTKGDG